MTTNPYNSEPLSHNGITQSIAAWSHITGIAQRTLRDAS
jgi:hypothetical protein